MTGWFELHKSANGQFNFVLKADDDHVLLRSEQYESKNSAQNGIASVQANCADDSHFDRKESADHKWYFNLMAANHRVIGTSSMYPTPQSRDADIAAVKANGVTATIRDIH
ncbi:MAG TPA: YegP family protein [Gammaproteobacteria bacterium]